MQRHQQQQPELQQQQNWQQHQSSPPSALVASLLAASHDGNLHDRAYQVGGSVVSDPVSIVCYVYRYDLRPPLSGVSAVACPRVRVSGGSGKQPLRFLCPS